MTTPTRPTRPTTGPRGDLFADRADARLDAWGLTTPLRRDGALAALVAVVSGVLVLLIAVTPPSISEVAFAPSDLVVLSGVLALQAAALCLRRRVPGTCLVATVALQVAALPLLPGGGSLQGPACAVAAYTCGTLLAPRRVTALVGAVAVLETAVFGLVVAPSLPSGTAVPLLIGHLATGLVLYGGAAVAGAFVATRRRYAGLVRLRAAEALQAQQARADAAVGQERARMARELHDIAAHHLTGMVVQAAVVEKLIDRDPAAARENAARVRHQGRETLRSLRLIVGALREDGERDADGLPDDGGPVPGLATLDRLVETRRESGTAVELVRQGALPELGPVADVTFYRVAQQALSNAAEHAPGAPVRVLLAGSSGGAVRLEVHNPLVGAGTPRPGGGFGLTGMRERADLVGAALEAGPDGDGGWRVELTYAPAPDPPSDARPGVPGEAP